MENKFSEQTNAVTSTFAAQFASIRADVCNRLQTLGAEYAMSVQKLVRTCIMTNMQIASLAELHAKNITKGLHSCNATLVNFTNCNAMINVDGMRLLVTFDLSKPGNGIQTAKYMEALQLATQADIATHILTLKCLQVLMLTPIDDANIVVPFEQLKLSVIDAKRELSERKTVLQETIRSRSNTAFDYQPGMSFFTVNYSDDMSMIFWDRYTIVEMTAKSYYVEQHCIVEHIISGDIEPERFICLHKPSKNNIAAFLADHLACLTALTRPTANVELSETSEVPVVSSADADEYAEEDEDALEDMSDDDKFTVEELAAMGVDMTTVDPSNVRQNANT